MPAELIKLYPKTPDLTRIRAVAKALREGAVVIYPTDTIYGLGCDIHQARAVERVARIKGIKPQKNDFSFICYDLSHLADYARVSNAAFKVMKRLLPGPFTFILEATNNVPKLLNTNRKTVGIRVPDNTIARLLVQELGNPLITTTLREEGPLTDEWDEHSPGIAYSTDPEQMLEAYRHEVDFVIDGGPGGYVPSTIIDATTDAFTILRQGLGVVDW